MNFNFYCCVAEKLSPLGKRDVCKAIGTAKPIWSNTSPA
jgi:hypothetical protein